MTSASRISTLLGAVACATTLIVGACSGNSFTDCTAVYTCAGGNGGAAAGNGGTTSDGGGSSAGTGGESGGIGGASGSAGASGAQTGGAAGSDLGGAGGMTGGTGGTTGGTGGTTTGGATGTGGAPATSPLWLAYLSSTNLPYLADLSKSTFPKIDLSSVVGPGCKASGLSFSPDGRTLAFMAGIGASCTGALFLVDVSKDTPGAPMQVDAGAVCQIIGWSLDGRWLAYHDTCSNNQTTWTTNYVVVDTDSSSFGSTTLVGANQQMSTYVSSFAWAGSSYLAWLDPQYKVHYAQHDGTGWLSPVTSSFTVLGGILIRGHANGRMLAQDSNQTTRGIVLDLPANRYYASNDIPNCYYSTDLMFVVAANTPIRTDTSAMNVLYSLDSTIPQLGTYDINASAVWATVADRFVLLSSGSNARFIDATKTPVMDAQIVSTLGYTKFRFAPDDSWVGMGSTSKLAASRVSSAGAASPTVVSTALPTGGTLSSSFAFAQDANSMWYLGQQTTAGVTELYRVDLSGSTPSAPAKLNAPLGSGVNVSSASFTRDSAHVVYVAGTSLYLADVNPVATGKLVLSSFNSYSLQP